MIPHRLQRACLFVVAFALITIEASILHGQRYSGDEDVESANGNSTSVVRSPYGAFPATSTGEAVGKANISPPSNGASNSPSSSTPRKLLPIPGPEPKRLMPRSSKAATTNPAYHNAPRSTVTQASHLDTTRGLDRDGNIPKQKALNREQVQNAASMVVAPAESRSRPPFHGSILNGETTVERIVRLETAKTDLERENDELRQLNAGLQSRVRESQDQLIAVVREIQVARKEVITARNDLERLRTDLQNLREKIRLAQKEHTDVLQSMGPLLQQLLESDDVGSLPPNPME